MKATVQSDERYTINVEGRSISGLRRGKTWNGMTEFRSDNGEAIIIDLDESLISAAFSHVFSAENEPRDGSVVKMSPGFIARANKP